MDEHDGFAAYNVYQMYVAQGSKPGLWIRRTTWGNTCARVTRMGAPKGPPLYFGNPEVRTDIYSLDGVLKEQDVLIPAAGTYKTWRSIERPSWWVGE